MTARKCDRCGKYYDKNEKKYIKVAPADTHRRESQRSQLMEITTTLKTSAMTVSKSLKDS